MKKTKLFAAFLTCMFAGVAFGLISLESGVAATLPSGQDYALQYSRYQLKEANAKVTYEGESVRTVNGCVTFKNVGEYIIEYASETVQVDVYKEAPESNFVFVENFSEVSSGLEWALPTVEITDFLGNVKSDYSITVLQGEEELCSFDSIDDAVYTFVENGDYRIRYDYETVFRTTDSYYYNVKASDKKTVYVSNYHRKSLPISEALDMEDFYGYYKGNKYDCNVLINGVEITSSTYEFTAGGEYEVEASSTIEGDDLKVEFILKVEYDYSKAFTTYDCLEVTDHIVSCPPNAHINRSNDGIQILTDKSDSTAVFGGVLDLAEIPSNQNVIEFHVLSNDYATMDFINVRLIDIYDPTNWIMVKWINCKDGGGTPKNLGTHSYVYVESSTGINTLITDKGKTVNYTATFYNKFRTDTSMFQFQMDYKNLQLYHYDMSYNASRHKSLCDLDDATKYGNDKVWKGFTDGKCYVQLEFLSVSGSQSGVIVTQIGGQNIYDYFANSDKFGLITLDADIEYIQNGLPSGVVGMKYPLPSAFTENIVRGEFDVSRKLYLGDEAVTDLIAENTFTPNEAGNYTLKFTTIDVFGRTVVYDMPFEVVDEYNEVLITEVPAGEPKVNSYWSVPEFVCSGGHGILKTETALFIDGVEVEQDEAGQVFIQNPCDIEVVVTVTDYLNRVKEETFTYTVSYSGSFFDIQGLPDCVKKGQTIEIPYFAAYNYDLKPTDSGYVMTTDIYVNGEAVTSGQAYTVSDENDLVFWFIADEGKATEEIEIYTVKVEEVAESGDMSGYFVCSDTVTAVTKDEYQSFSFATSSVVTFKNALAADSLNLQFGFDKGTVGVSSFTIRLTDYFNPSIYLDLDVYAYNDGYSKVVVGDKEGYVPGSVTGTKFDVYYNNLESSLQSAAGLQYVKINRTAQNNVFKGFEKGLVKLSFIFDNVSSATEFKVFSFGNQTFNRFVYTKGDRQGPMFMFNELMEAHQEMSINSVLSLNNYKAYDVLQGLGTIKASLVDPSGNYLYKNKNLELVEETTLSKYGYWVLIYTGFDSLGNSTQKKINIYVVDEIKPTVNVDSSKIKAKYSIGETLSIPQAVVADDTAVTVNVYVLSPDGKFNFVNEGDKFRLTMKGNHTLCFLVYDVDYNITRVEIEFTVS